MVGSALSAAAGGLAERHGRTELAVLVLAVVRVDIGGDRVALSQGAGLALAGLNEGVPARQRCSRNHSAVLGLRAGGVAAGVVGKLFLNAGGLRFRTGLPATAFFRERVLLCLAHWNVAGKLS